MIHSIHGITPPGNGGTILPPRLVRAAHEFEAQMMKELLKPMHPDGASSLDGDDGGDAGSTEALGEFSAEALGRALSEAGGLGIAKHILKALSQPGKSSNSVGINELSGGKSIFRITE